MEENTKLIRAEDAIDILFAEFQSYWEIPCLPVERDVQRRVSTIRDKINKLDPVGVGVVLQGKWVCVPAAEGLPRYQCSHCGHYVETGNDRNFCPNCGTRMVNVQDEIYKLPLEGFVEIEKYNELREAFVDYVCSGVPNKAPYCKNRCPECMDGRGWCRESFCKGFCP